MRRLLIGLALTFAAASTLAQTIDENAARCTRGDPDAKIGACTVLIESPQLPPIVRAAALANRGTAYRAKTLYDQAIADETQAISLNPNFSAAYYNRGVAYHFKKLYDQAIADYTQAIALKPDDADAYVSRANAYVRKGLYDQAVADCTQAIAIDARSAKAYVNRGDAYRDKGMNDLAIADYRVAVTIDPNDPRPREGLSKLGVAP
jgi:tetratricopeptide (TPR) repeat protein